MIQDQGVHYKWTPDHNEKEDPRAEHQQVPLPHRQAFQSADQTPKEGLERDNESGARRILRRQDQAVPQQPAEEAAPAPAKGEQRVNGEGMQRVVRTAGVVGAKLAPVAEDNVNKELLTHAEVGEMTQGAPHPITDPGNNHVNKQVEGQEGNQASVNTYVTLREEGLTKGTTCDKNSTTSPMQQKLLDKLAQVLGGHMAIGAADSSTHARSRHN